MKVRLVENGAPRILSEPERQELDAAVVARFDRRSRAELGLREAALEVVTVGEEIALRSRNITGVGRFGRLEVEVVPKYLAGDDEAQDQWSLSFLHVVLLAVTERSDAEMVSAVRGGHTIVDALVEAFGVSAERGLAAGVPLRYEVTDASGVFPQGPFDRRRIAEWRARPWETPYIRSELTNISDLTRYLWWALVRLRALPMSEASARRIAGLAEGFRLRGIDREARVPMSPPTQGRHRLFAPALLVADILRTASGLGMGSGPLAVPGLFWASSFVFERAFRRLGDSLASTLGSVALKPSYRLGTALVGSSHLRTQPDLTVRRRGVPIAVLDAKYKIFATRPDPEDGYQIIAGGLAAGCSNLALVYPSTTEGELGRWRAQSPVFPFEVTALPVRLHLLGLEGGRTIVETEIRQWLDEVVGLQGRQAG